MKPETANLLKSHLDQHRFKFVDSELGLELEHDFSDDEKKELVELEYGPKLVAPVDELFVAIMKKLIKLAVNKAKEEI
jgi:hypothetical protein